MVRRKGLGSSHNGRDFNAQRLSVKHFGGQFVKVDEIIARQRDTHFYPGRNVGRDNGDTLFATAAGSVEFGTFRGRRVIGVVLPET